MATKKKIQNIPHILERTKSLLIKEIVRGRNFLNEFTSGVEQQLMFDADYEDLIRIQQLTIAAVTMRRDTEIAEAMRQQIQQTTMINDKTISIKS